MKMLGRGVWRSFECSSWGLLSFYPRITVLLQIWIKMVLWWLDFLKVSYSFSSSFTKTFLKIVLLSLCPFFLSLCGARGASAAPQNPRIFSEVACPWIVISCSSHGPGGLGGKVINKRCHHLGDITPQSLSSFDSLTGSPCSQQSQLVISLVRLPISSWCRVSRLDVSRNLPNASYSTILLIPLLKFLNDISKMGLKHFSCLLFSRSFSFSWIQGKKQVANIWIYFLKYILINFPKLSF